MAGFMADVFALLESSGAERLIIDLRRNSGGNSTVLARFVPDLAANVHLAAPGSLRVLIGPATYSAGMTNAYELRTGARARLYGEPTGGKPDSWGELRTFTLPRSGLVVTYSADWFKGVDPVLVRALTE
jgi:C-terminal processing protease CtpA/Prc